MKPCVATGLTLTIILGLFFVSFLLAVLLTTDQSSYPDDCTNGIIHTQAWNTRAVPDRQGHYPRLTVRVKHRVRPRLTVHVVPMYPQPKEVATTTIFVSLPSYRDPEAPHTLLSAFKRAANPHLVFVGVCQQNTPIDKPIVQEAVEVAKKTLKGDELARMLMFLRSNVRVFAMNSKDAKGPVFARSIIEEKLYKDESLLVMIDSHTQFAPQWDVLAQEELAACPYPDTTVLTTYPNTYKRSNREDGDFSQVPQKLVFSRFENGSNAPLWNTMDLSQDEVDAKEPPLSLGWGACCSIAPRSVVKTVPFHDRHQYPFLFFGEEAGMAARFFTNGIDLRAPRSNIVLTTYERSYRPLYWDEAPPHHTIELRSQAAMQQLLGLGRTKNKGERGRYGEGYLGACRRLEDYEDYMGVDFGKFKAIPRALVGPAKITEATSRRCSQRQEAM